MTVFWHHVGDDLSKRDFPLTIGSQKIGLREFDFDDIMPYIDEIVGPSQREFQDSKDRIGSSKFQIWGIPSGAKSALKNLKLGDTFLLLNTDQSYGFFEYSGRVLCRLPSEQWRLSFKLWGERKFPLIVLLRGNLIHYPWPNFLDDMSYGAGFKGMGRVHTIAKPRLSETRFGSEESFLEHLSSGATN